MLIDRTIRLNIRHINLRYARRQSSLFATNNVKKYNAKICRYINQVAGRGQPEQAINANNKLNDASVNVEDVVVGRSVNTLSSASRRNHSGSTVGLHQLI